MVDELEVPAALAGREIDGDEALGEEVVARAVPAVVVAGRRLDGQVGEAQLGVGRDLRPDAVVAVAAPGVGEPGVGAELAGAGNGAERPEPLAAADVEGLHEPLDVVVRPRCRPVGERAADEHHVARHGRGGVGPDGAGREVDGPPVADHGRRLEVHRPARAEAGDPRPGAGVERHEAEADRHVEDARLFAVGPVRQPAPGQAARRRRGPLPLVLAVHPEQLAGRGVERDHGPARPGGGVDDAAGHHRGAFELELGRGAEVVGPEAPGDLELPEVRGVDLVER